jgi:cytochrome c oxidase subunit 3
MADAHHAKPNHDYHLVNPSPWPFVGSVSAFVMAVGAILWFHAIGAEVGPDADRLRRRALHHVSPGGATSCARRRRATTPGRADAPPLRHDPVHRLRGDVLRRLVLGLFRRLFFNYDQVEQYARVAAPAATGRRPGVELFDPFHLPLFNTLILLTSGTTVTWAHHALLHGDKKGLKGPDG